MFMDTLANFKVTWDRADASNKQNVVFNKTSETQLKHFNYSPKDKYLDA